MKSRFVNSMRRVLLAVHKFFPKHRSGTEVLTLQVAKELLARGYKVLIVTANPPDLDARHCSGADTSDEIFQGIPVHIIEEPLRLKNYTFRCEYDNPAIAEHFQGVLKDFKPDLLHIFHAQNLSGSIIDAARNKNIPVVCTATDFWFVCPIVQLKRPDGAVCGGPGPQAVNCLTCYTPQLFPGKTEFRGALTKKYPLPKILSRISFAQLQDFASDCLFAIYKLKKLPQAITATVMRPKSLLAKANSTSAIMVPTQLMREIFIKNGITERLIYHVPFGIDAAALAPYQTKTASQLLRIGFIGTLFEHKGVDLLIKAFQALPAEAALVLKIYGDTEQFPEYGKLLRELAGEDSLPMAKRLEFCGTFPNEMLGQILQGIDVLVVPSRWLENTPLVIQSALATKTPVIATDLGGMSELIHHGKNGFLFRLNDVDSLKEQLLHFVKDPTLVKRLATNIVRERTISEMVDDIEAIYAKVLPSYSFQNKVLRA